LSSAWRTLAEPDLAEELARWIDGSPGLVRVAVDGADCLGPARLAGSLLQPLRAAGHPAHHVQARAFWRDASVRLEHGREDAESYPTWLDAAALRREVLDAAVRDHVYLPTLRDPATNRSTRDEPRPIGERDVLLVSGEFLLGLGLPFDRTVYLTAPHAALERRTPADHRWTLAAHAAYADTARPADTADIVVRCDRKHPVVQGLPC
jgi:hypothetical protein